MKTRQRFLVFFAAQALAAAVAAALFAFQAIASENARAEAELEPRSGTAESAQPGIGPAGEAPESGASASLGEPKLPDANERLTAALREADALRAEMASARLFRSQAAIEAAARIGTFSVAWAAAAALAFALVSKAFTRRLDELSAGAFRAAGERSFRFPGISDREFGPVFEAFNTMLDRLAEQEIRLEEAARLEGWKEVSSFLFHQLRNPISSLELASRNVSLAADRAGAGLMTSEAALAACASSSASSRLECERVRALLDRFKGMAGLRMGTAAPVDLAELIESLRARVRPDRATLAFSGDSGPIPGDSRMIEEALLNLAANAAEACGKPPALVRFESTRERDSLVVEVEDDNGPIDPKILERIGRERFSTKAEGTGLGLLFVRRVAALHGGGFELYLTRDGGFGARLRFPLDPATAGKGRA